MFLYINGYYSDNLAFTNKIEDIYRVKNIFKERYRKMLRSSRSEKQVIKKAMRVKTYQETLLSEHKSTFCISLAEDLKEKKTRIKNYNNKTFYVKPYKITQREINYMFVKFFGAIVKVKAPGLTRRLYKNALMTMLYGAGKLTVEERLKELITEKVIHEHAYIISNYVNLYEETNLMTVSEKKFVHMR